MAFRLIGLPMLSAATRKSLKDDGDAYFDYSQDSGGSGGGDYSGDYSGDTSTDTSGDQAAPDAGQDTWNQVIEGEDGSYTYTDETGTSYYQDAEGNTTVLYDDGSGVVYNSDGTTTQWDADGNLIDSPTVDENGNMGPQLSDAEKEQKKEKAQPLAQKAQQAAAGALEKAKSTGTTPQTTAAPKPPAILPKGIAAAVALKTTSATTAPGATIGGLSIGTILLLGATGAFLLYKKKG